MNDPQSHRSGTSFILVAPLRCEQLIGRGLDKDVDSDRRVQDSSGFILLSRQAYQPRELWQNWFPISSAPDVPSVIRAWLVQVQTSSFLAAECAMTTDDISTPDLETALSRIVPAICSADPRLHGCTPTWVNRTLLLPPDSMASLPVGWLSREPSTHLLQDDIDRSLEVMIGWGNNAIRGWSTTADHSTQSESVMGLVDAQFLWCELTRTDETTARIAHSVIDRSVRLSRREFTAHLESLDQMSDAIALHRLNYDDVLMNIQGARHTVAKACLAAWGYSEVFERISDRLPVVKDATERELVRSSRRYQGIVQGVLTFVAALALTDFMVGLYSLAISGTNIIPSATSLALRGFELSNIDVILLVGLLSVMVVIALQRRGGGPR
ncbi:MAG TPA: hypothetical protein PLS37_10435 [Propioniciclava tarda]|nr:hypothetical protein [Propioniciclava tarda]